MTDAPDLSDLDHAQRRSARLIVLGQSASKLGDVAANAKTVLTWLMGVVGAPPALTALLVPIREAGSMLPQAFLSGFAKRVQRRKWVYALGAGGQTLSLAAMGVAALFMQGTTAGLAILFSLTLYSLARCLCSIASKDVLGKTLPKGTRGRITGIATAVSGALGLALGLGVLLGMDETASQEFYGWMILAASSLYLLAATAIAMVGEPKSDAETEDLLADFRNRVQLVWRDSLLRRFVIARTLLLGSALASPYLVILSQQRGFELRSLAAFVLAGGLASALSSMMWGKLSDRSSQRAMALGGGIAGVIGLAGVVLAMWLPALAEQIWTWPTLFFLLHLGYAGVRIGRKTYVVDAASGSQRTDYVSVSNSLIALMILAFGAAGSVLQSLHTNLALAFFSLLCLAGSFYTLTLKKT